MPLRVPWTASAVDCQGSDAVAETAPLAGSVRITMDAKLDVREGAMWNQVRA